jgi:beta-lactamase superfamily II metal-dependent hydrolase
MATVTLMKWCSLERIRQQMGTRDRFVVPGSRSAKNRSVLLGADAFPSIVERSVKRLLAGTAEKRLEVDVLKVCHHGSEHNTSPTLASKLAAKKCLVSTNGNRHKHPHQAGIARLIYYDV